MIDVDNLLGVSKDNISYLDGTSEEMTLEKLKYIQTTLRYNYCVLNKEIKKLERRKASNKNYYNDPDKRHSTNLIMSCLGDARAKYDSLLMQTELVFQK